MEKTQNLKRFTGPAALALFAWGLDMKGFHSDFVAGIAVGAAVFWLFMVLAAERTKLKKFKFVREWMPWLTPQGLVVEVPEELTSSYLTNRVFKLSDVAFGNQIQDRTFDRCSIYGPAVLELGVRSSVVECKLDRPESQCIWAIGDESINPDGIIGPFVATDTHFKKCSFHGIGIMGSPEKVEELRQNVRNRRQQIEAQENKEKMETGSPEKMNKDAP